MSKRMTTLAVTAAFVLSVGLTGCTDEEDCEGAGRSSGASVMMLGGGKTGGTGGGSRSGSRNSRSTGKNSGSKPSKSRKHHGSHVDDDWFEECDD